MTDREIVVINKNDLAEKTTAETVKALKPDAKCVSLSALDEESLKPLKDMLRERTAVTDNLALTQPRHLDAARRALKALKDALMTLDQMTPDMAATDLQAAQAALGEITGDRADEKLLDSVFSRFCVGK